MLRMKAPLRPMSCAARRGAARALSKAAQDYAVTPYRLIAHASESQRAAWAERDLILHSEMRKHVPAALKHNGEEAFDHHLVSVQSVLRSWGAPEYMTNAALFHSIYGTEGFQGFALPLHHRPEIADLIGPRAERLAWIFCMVDRHSVDRTILAPWALDPSVYVHKPPSFFARPELGGFEIPLRTYDEWLDFLALSLADWLEQVEGTANKEVPLPVGEGLLWELGQAWGCTGAHGLNHRPRESEELARLPNATPTHTDLSANDRVPCADRRHAYAKMAELLGERGPPWGRQNAPRMYAEIFAREPQSSRSFVQPLTPPMSQSAIDARDALKYAHRAYDVA